MGYGSGGAGGGPFGFDPVVAGAGVGLVGASDMPFIDLATGDVPIDANGNYIGTHPVDHEVQMIVGTQVGRIVVVPGLGTTLADVTPEADATAVTRTALASVTSALDRLIKAGDIKLVSVIATSPAQGRVRTIIKYINLRLPDPSAPELIGTLRTVAYE